MATKNLIPRGNGEGGIGIAGTSWGSGVFNTGVFNDSLTVGGSEVALSSELSNYVLTSDFGTYVTVGSLDSDFGFGANLTVDGSIGIGVDPDHDLHVSGSTPSFKLEGSQPRVFLKENDQTDLNTLIRLDNSRFKIDTVADDDEFLHNRFTILNNNGNVGIGATSPDAKLSVMGAPVADNTDLSPEKTFSISREASAGNSYAQHANFFLSRFEGADIAGVSTQARTQLEIALTHSNGENGEILSLIHI